jgi:hypothetical protein
MKKSFLLSILTSVTFLSVNTNSVYSQDDGKIIFSTDTLSLDNMTNVTDSFKTSDYIYGLAVTNDTLKNICGVPNAKKVKFSLGYSFIKQPLYSYQSPSEEFIDYSAIYVTGSALNNKYLILDIIPDPKKMSAYKDKEITFEKFGIYIDGPVKQANSFSKFQNGKQNIRFKLRCDNTDVDVVSGDFFIEGNDFSKYSKLSEEYKKIFLEGDMENAKMPPAKMTDKKLEKEMIELIQKSETFKTRIKSKIIKLNIIDSDWYIRRNDFTGAILHRYIRAAIAVKDSSGSCSVWSLVSFQQDYFSNKFQKTKFDGVGDNFKIKCENISK